MSEIVVSRTNLALQSAPIHPDWIRAGAPEARYRIIAQSRDAGSQTILWDCTAGEFDWFYDVDETIHILEGGMTLTDASGTRRIGVGEVVFFPAGSHARWVVDSYVRKVAVIHQPLPGPLALVMRAWRKLTRRAPAHAAPAESPGEPAMAGQTP